MSTRKERLGIYGGTFSPIHCGHVNAARAFLESMSLDRVLVVPTSIPPHKAPIEGATAGDRLEMVRLAFDGAGDSKIEACDYEMTQPGKSYTVYTIEHFAVPERELFMLVGTDMFFTLERWFRAEDIFRLADIVLMRRENDVENFDKIKNQRRKLCEEYGARVYEIDEPPFVISSTELREKLSERSDISGFVPDSVIRYIEENNLYR